MSDKEPIRIETGPMAGPGAPVRVGKRIPGLSSGQALGMLKGEIVPEKVVQDAVRASERLHPDLAGHVPQIGALGRPEGAWGVFCGRCTVESQEYIYPCKVAPLDWPPKVLVAYTPTSTDRLEVTDE